MPTKPLALELSQEALNLVAKYGGVKKAADVIGMHHRSLHHRYMVALSRGQVPHVDRVFQQSETGKAVLVIPDMHCPFMHPDAIAFLTEAKDRLKPSRIVHLGDEIDHHALSQYDPDPDGYSAGHELGAAKEQIRPLFSLFPDMRICESNHGLRPFKAAYRAGIPRAYLKDYAQFLDCPPGWAWAHRWEVDGVIYVHGEGFSGLNAHRRWAEVHGQPTVIGHIHSHAGIAYVKSDTRQIWGMNSGCLIDSTKYAFRYAKQHPHKAVLSVGFVDNATPFLFPMRLDHNGRWTGKW